jgi:pathogenesis-related protein 1
VLIKYSIFIYIFGVYIFMISCHLKLCKLKKFGLPTRKFLYKYPAKVGRKQKKIMEASNLALLVVLAMAAAMLEPSNAQNSPQDYVTAHNAARAAVGVGLRPVAWDAAVASYAESYARQRSGDCELAHSDSQYGENLFWGSGVDWTAAQAVEKWADERSDYSYASNSCVDSRMCGHYTQIVWRNSTGIGCARVVCDHDAGTFITCNYSPPGNYIGERPY